MPHRPARQKASIAPAQHPQTFRINKGALAQRLVQAGHHIREVATAPITVYCPCKRLAVALTATWIGVDHRISCSGVHLEFVEEIMPILRVGSAVDIE